jgi:hypothetical protein
VAELVAYEAVGLGRRASKAVLEFDGRLKFMSKSNNQAWNTKYGPRRVRYEPPTLREAIAAAQGLSDELNEQAEIAASLIGLSRDQVRTELLKVAPSRKGSIKSVAFAGLASAPRTIVVERKPARRVIAGR